MTDPRTLKEMLASFPDGFYMMNISGKACAAGIKIPRENMEVYLLLFGNTKHKLGRRMTEVVAALNSQELAAAFKQTLDEMANRPWIHIDTEVVRLLVNLNTAKDDEITDLVRSYIDAVNTAKTHPRILERAFLATRPVHVKAFDTLDDMFDQKYVAAKSF